MGALFFLLGLFIGGILGFGLAALMTAAKINEEESEKDVNNISNYESPLSGTKNA